MRKQVGVIVAAFFYYSGLLGFARRWMQRKGQTLIILNYHRATGGNLRRHLIYLRRHYRMMHLEEALEELYNAHHEESKPKSDRRTLLSLTFDDGYFDNYTHAFTLARELQVPITIFLIPGYIESGKTFWWLEGRRLAYITKVEKVSIEGYTYQLQKPMQRDKLAQAIDTHLFHATSVTERDTFLENASKTLAISHENKLEEAFRPLTWNEVREMEKSSWVSFGAHTMHHPILAYLADPEEVKREVSDCQKHLKQQLGHPVRTFAYPVGKLEHIGNEGLQAVRNSEYSWAVTTVNGVSTRQSDPYLLQRLLGDVSRNWLVMAAEVSGIWKIVSPLWKNSICGSGMR